jgi:hypothetical protein
MLTSFAMLTWPVTPPAGLRPPAPRHPPASPRSLAPRTLVDPGRARRNHVAGLRARHHLSHQPLVSSLHTSGGTYRDRMRANVVTECAESTVAGSADGRRSRNSAVSSTCGAPVTRDSRVAGTRRRQKAPRESSRGGKLVARCAESSVCRWSLVAGRPVRGVARGVAGRRVRGVACSVAGRWWLGARSRPRLGRSPVGGRRSALAARGSRVGGRGLRVGESWKQRGQLRLRGRCDASVRQASRAPG